VLRGELQAGFGVLPIVDQALWVERVAHEPFCVCLTEHHRLATHSRLAARELSNETLVWIPRSIHRLFYDNIVNYLLTLKFNSRRFLEAHTITQALDLAAHGAGVALLPQSASRFQRPGVLFKPLTDDLLRIETALFVPRVHNEARRNRTDEFFTRHAEIGIEVWDRQIHNAQQRVFERENQVGITGSATQLAISRDEKRLRFKQRCHLTIRAIENRKGMRRIVATATIIGADGG
jgi:hypothetical protein